MMRTIALSQARTCRRRTVFDRALHSPRLHLPFVAMVLPPPPPDQFERERR